MTSAGRDQPEIRTAPGVCATAAARGPGGLQGAGPGRGPHLAKEPAGVPGNWPRGWPGSQLGGPAPPPTHRRGAAGGTGHGPLSGVALLGDIKFEASDHNI